jgi:divalent metal cation (Fe/Co/Zn/Cd) transporter
MVAWTGWQRLDPILALAVAANIISTGVGIVRRSVGGLMDTALLVEDRVAVWQVLKGHEQAGVKFHALWTRQAHVEFKVAGRIHMQKNAPQVSL